MDARLPGWLTEGERRTERLRMLGNAGSAVRRARGPRAAGGGGVSSLPDRALRGLTDAGEVRRALDERRVMHHRDEARANWASELYEELRELSTAELVERAGGDSVGPCRADS